MWREAMGPERDAENLTHVKDDTVPRPEHSSCGGPKRALLRPRVLPTKRMVIPTKGKGIVSFSSLSLPVLQLEGVGEKRR